MDDCERTRPRWQSREKRARLAGACGKARCVCSSPQSKKSGQIWRKSSVPIASFRLSRSSEGLIQWRILNFHIYTTSLEPTGRRSARSACCLFFAGSDMHSHTLKRLVVTF